MNHTLIVSTYRTAVRCQDGRRLMHHLWNRETAR